MTYTIPKGFYGKPYSFFHNFFKGLYPNMYKDIIGNLQQDDSTEPVPEPVPFQRPPQEERQERSADEIAMADEVRLRDRLAGKYRIQGMTVKMDIPTIPVGQKGMSPSISKFETGIASDPNMLGVAFPSLANLNESIHAKNVETLLKEGIGGVGQVYNP